MNTDSIDSLDDPAADDLNAKNDNDPLKSKRISELEQELEQLYSSMDANNGILEDNYLIP